jgi:hypothetical protein
MAEPVLSQIWEAYNDGDNEKPLVGTVDASGYSLAVYISTAPGAPHVLALTPSISTVTITMLLSKADTDTLTGSPYLGGEWYWALRRTNVGSVKPLAAGQLTVNVVPTS